jgi:hypothetical protein
MALAIKMKCLLETSILDMYHFKLNQDRTELLSPLDDKIADTEGESVSDSALFATGFVE